MITVANCPQMRAIQRFKGLISPSRATTPRASHAPRLPAGDPDVNQPIAPLPSKQIHETNEPIRQKSVAEEAAELIKQRKAYLLSGLPFRATSSEQKHKEEAQAPNPTDKNTPFLGIGTGGDNEFSTPEPSDNVVSESPTGIDFDVYDRAFETEIKRIRSDRKKHRSRTYMTKLLGEKERDKYAEDDCMISEAGRPLARSKAQSLTHEAGRSDRQQREQQGNADSEPEEGAEGIQRIVGATKDAGSRFADLVASMARDRKGNRAAQEQND